jgi:exopolysaccharide biosynthesis polyprenyl glycosylphosphotransferase
MGDSANIIAFRALHRPKAVTATAGLAPIHSGYSDFARLIPGISDASSNDNRSQTAERVRPPICAGLMPRSVLSRIAAELQPRFFKRVQASMLVPGMVDVTLIILVFAFERWLLGSSLDQTFNFSKLCIYVASFLIFSIEEDLYSPRKVTMAENGAAIRAVGWATLFTSFSPGWSQARISVMLVFALSLGTLLVLVATRRLRRALLPANDHKRNVLIVGSGTKAQEISDAIRHDPSSARLVKGYVAENHIRNVYGRPMLSRIAREEFVDEIIIASTDPGVTRIAIQEARRNKLDVKFAPDICVPCDREIVFDSVGHIPLLRIHEHRPPEYRLAFKRSLDVVFSLCGLIVVSPLLLLIAATIKLDSSGPIFYRATRTGRKGRPFFCYKFRTMIAGADAVKDDLRARNERDGAFFKIGNDPRVTTIGRFLRRYSLDEIPQLLNVLLGDMSLVGPRPHPPDDVSLYKIQHLQRLDFVPGITGLWQVTARRDPSFERSVALDVEYIKNWNLWLDLRILCKTVGAVLAGSGV